MGRFLLCLLFVFPASTYISFAQCPASVPLTIASIATTESRCQSSGTATVLVSGGSAPYIYSIISGPITASPQSADVFSSLAPGSYTVQVTDNCNTTITGNFSIDGTYSIPQVTTTLQSPVCQGGNDGAIQIDVANGRSPFMYSLVSPSPVTAGPQPGNLFTGLTAGTYTCVVTDSCGNYQTRTVLLLDGDNAVFSLSYGNLHYEACDSFSFPYRIYPNIANNNRPPYVSTLTLPDGTTQTHVINSNDIDPNGFFIPDTFHFRYNHRSGDLDLFQIEVENNCGVSATTQYSMSVLDMGTSFDPIPDCSGQYKYVLDRSGDNNPSNPFPQVYHCNTITYTLVSPSNVLLATQTNNSSFTGYPPGNGYKVIREDCCKKDTLQFDWQQAPALKITGYSVNPNDVCKEGTTNVNLSINVVTNGSIIIASGPPSVTFADGTVHSYIYPDTVSNQPFGTTGVNINYFTTGTYKLYAIDTCGQKDSITFTITASQLRHSAFSTRLIKGCVGANKITWTAVSNAGPTQNFPDATVRIDQANVFRFARSSPYTDSAINLSSGTYHVDYTYRTRFFAVSYLKGMESYSCDVIRDTIVIPPYTSPLFNSSAAIAVCGPDRNIALLPDSIRGVPPYQYQVTSGAAATPLQSSPVFSNLSAGTYNFLMADACGNSYSTNITIDTLAVPDILITGSTCEGGTATLTLPSSPFYSYTWQGPNGIIHTGNSIIINPITQTDTGIYTINLTSTIGTCTDSESRNVRFNFCMTLPLTLLNFAVDRIANGLLLKWQTADEINTSHFIAEKSTDGLHFIPFHRVNATGDAANTYSIADNNISTGISYYRLQMADKDGKIKYSKIISFNNKAIIKPDVHPRLITNEIPILVTHPKTSGTAFVQVIGTDGRVWLTKSVAKGLTQTTVETTRLAKGAYLVVFINENEKEAVQVIKQ